MVPPIAYLTILPLSLMFLMERYTLYRLSRTQEGKEWVRSKFWLHPNFISRCRYPMGFVSLSLYHMGTWIYPDVPGNFWHHAGILWFGFWMISDVTDGTIARLFDLGSPEGEIIDPFSDKLLLFPPLFYFAFTEFIPLYLVLIFLFFDTTGTVSRYFIQHKAANLFGKAKTLLAATTLVLITMQQIYYPGPVWAISIATLAGAVFLSFCSVFFKIIPNYWYANILSILNLICGLAGIGLILVFNQTALAFALVFLGQFLDMFDGRAADRWGSTPKGELLDDLADATNFGGTISMIIYASFQKGTIGIVLGLLHFSFTTFRLYRFILNKRKAGVEGGMDVFVGLPCPAAALITGSVALLHINDYFRIGCIVFISFLMISRLPYIHFGRVILPAIPKLFKVLLLTLVILAVWIGFRPGNSQFLYWTVFIVSFAYIVLGYNWKKHQHNVST
ncbi:MAG: CDP-diacylglycerol--glycerol-3-phosphate 3-phosphatidyltransferase [Proteobacteria bacterium]|nr:CDP-diacylglycerol--glycerol-3-phosphate 3-phosphatidyltransferase [Pseudomonadota bacterium]